MTNQSHPLTLKLSNGQEVSIAQAKSVLRHTENGQQSSCVIVRGPAGTAIYNAEGEVQINGAPSSAHWLQPGDNLQFGGSLSASVEQLGVANEALASLLNETLPNETQPNVLANEEVQPAVQTTPTEPATATRVSVTDEATFTPATAATAFTIEPQLAPTAPIVPAVPENVATEPSPTAADYAIPAATAATLAALGVAAIPGESAAPVATPDEPIGFTPTPNSVAEPASDRPTGGFAAELLASIQADESDDQQNENLDETVGILASETTHSPLAADGPSFSHPADEANSISNLIPELPSAPAETPVLVDQPESLETATSAPVETTTTESAERQSQSSSVSALLERMKDEGQWGGLSEAEVEEASAPAAPETTETPVLDEADEDVQSYMSQLLSRMRDPNEEPPKQAVAAAVKAPEPAQETQVVPETPQPAGLLKPEEYIPKNKARRLDSLQDMRALANNQTRTAIDRSQAKRREASMGNFNLTIAGISYVAAATIYLFGIFGFLSIPFSLIALTTGAFYCVKAFFAELLDSKKKLAAKAAQADTQAVAEPAQDVL